MVSNMNNCPDCGRTLEQGDTETDKHNMYVRVTYYCDFCQVTWSATYDNYEQTETIQRGEG